MEDKIKLEEELEFLKESFDAEVISKVEYEKAKARIKAQLNSIKAKKEEKPKKEPASKEKTAENIQEEVKTEEEKSEIKGEEPKPEVEVQKEKPEEGAKAEEKKEGLKVEEKKKEPVIKEEKKVEEVKKVSETQSVSDDAQKAKLSDKAEVKPEEEKKEEPSLKEEKIEIKEIKEPSKIKEAEEPKKESEADKAEHEETKEIDEKEKDTNDILTSRNGFPEEDTKKKTSMWVPVVSGVLLLVIVYFSFLFLLNNGAGEKEATEIPPACFSDDNCLKEGMIGLCSNPGSQDAECEFKEDAKINLIVLNTKDCFNCDTSRVEKIIKKWFPSVIKKEIEFSSEEGTALAKNLNIELLPSFIFNSSLEEASRYEELKSIFSKVNSNYILSPSASGSAYYISRGEIPNKLEVFLMKDDASTEKAEKNIEEFLKLFDGSVDYKKHIVDKGSSLINELRINTFPTFLVNNKIRFSGVQPPEKIKDHFCKVNSLDKCSSKLSENLV